MYQRWGLAEALHLHYRLSALVLDENKPPDIHHVPSALVLIPQGRPYAYGRTLIQELCFISLQNDVIVIVSWNF